MIKVPQNFTAVCSRLCYTSFHTYAIRHSPKFQHFFPFLLFWPGFEGDNCWIQVSEHFKFNFTLSSHIVIGFRHSKLIYQNIANFKCWTLYPLYSLLFMFPTINFLLLKYCQVLMKETGVSWNKRFKRQYGSITKVCLAGVFFLSFYCMKCFLSCFTFAFISDY